MNKFKLYSVNQPRVQFAIAEVIEKHKELVDLHLIPVADLMMALENRLFNNKTLDDKYVFHGIVMWTINNGHVINKNFLNESYKYLSEIIINDFKNNGSEVKSGFPIASFPALRQEILKEELSILSHVLYTNEPYLNRIPVILAKNFFNSIKVIELARRFPANRVMLSLPSLLNQEPGSTISFSVPKNREPQRN